MGEASTELSSSEREGFEEPPVPPISLRDQSLIITDQENIEGSEKDSNSSSEGKANKTIIESKDCIEDDALNASITHAASNDSSSSSSEGDLLPIFQSTM